MPLRTNIYIYVKREIGCTYIGHIMYSGTHCFRIKANYKIYVCIFKNRQQLIPYGYAYINSKHNISQSSVKRYTQK